MKEKLIIYWSRRDFRLSDNKALSKAVLKSLGENTPLLPVFVLENYMCKGDAKYQFGYPSRYFISKALPYFAKNFPNFLLTKSKAAKFFIDLSKKYDLEIFVNEDVHPDFYKQIKKISNQDVSIKLFRDQLTAHKETKTGSDNYYSVFTPFKKAIWKDFIETTEDPKVNLEKIIFFDLEKLKDATQIKLDQESILKEFSDDENLLINSTIIDLTKLSLPKRDLDFWYFSEQQAHDTFDQYLKEEMSMYKDKRDSLEIDTTSKMSLALAWGLISARTLKNKIQKHFSDSFENLYSETSNSGSLHYISELIWREFYKYLYFHNPKLIDTEFQEKFKNIKWLEDKHAKQRFIAWIKGETGYKIVDAAMMQLAQTGWMHNRSRMIVASILTKNLGVDWRWGQEYFRAMLIDLDEASNNGGWQWGASVGADPKPIRIFNPYLQAENYDKKGVYQKKWLSKEYFAANILPIIKHKDAREEALKRYGLSKDFGARDY
jgi:deoxyribodipyrimidine photo-lyase